jgi:poly-gamma-glutamate synthesis protein (capsule biosynthesis protein)
MHPKNIDLLTTAGIDFCSLANNHIMDWGKEGLLETLEKLKAADILQAGAGKNRDEAQNPAVLQSPKGRVIIMAFGSTSSGIPGSWAAGKEQPGVNMLPNAGKSSFSKIKRQIAAIRQPGDIVIFSVHWGDNWGYQVPGDQREFAHLLIDRAGVDLIYGHSSHHPRGIEVYRNKLILYGTGDFLNDYEGISGHEQYRGDLTLMYFPQIDPADGTLHSLKLIPMQIKNFQLNPVNQGDREWLLQVLNEKVTLEGTSVRLNQDGSFSLHWP